MGKGNGAMVAINGSMAPMSGGGKISKVVRDRKFLTAKVLSSKSEQVLSSSQSPYPIGSQYSNVTLLFTADYLSSSAKSWIQNYDKYRILLVEVYATLSVRSLSGAFDKNLPVEVYFYEDTDADLGTQTSWIRTSDRLNVGKVILNSLTPSQKLISFQPTVSFAATTSDAQNPANVVPKKGIYLDALSLSQIHSGLRVFTACPNKDTQGQTYEYEVHFSTRYHIQVTQPI